jgi:non-ribosomal peptide synthetase component F
VVDLPRDADRPAVQTYRGAQVSAPLPAVVSAAVRALSNRLGVTVPAVLLAAFGVLVHRLTGQDDLVIGTPAADRRHLAFQDLVGFFIEVIPLRVRADPARAFADIARACSDEVLAALAHPAAPLDRIVDVLGVPRDPARPPLVQVLFNVYNFPEPHLELDGLCTLRLPAGVPGSPFDLTMYVAERGHGHAVDLVYNPDLFSARRAGACLDYYLTLLGELAGHPDRAAGQAPGPPAAAQQAARAAGAAPPAGAGAVPAGSGHAPSGPTELALAAIWREVLGRDEVSATANFFDAGGSSMVLVTVRTRVAERLGRELPVAELFQYPSIRSLAGHLDGSSGAPELARAAARAAARRQRSRRPGNSMQPPGRTAPAERGGQR